MNQDCNSRLKKLQQQFTNLLISSGNRNVSLRNSYQRNQISLNRLVANGFKPKVAKIVFAKIQRSGRPMNHYAKSTGALKKKHKTATLGASIKM